MVQSATFLIQCTWLYTAKPSFRGPSGVVVLEDLHRLAWDIVATGLCSLTCEVATVSAVFADTPPPRKLSWVPANLSCDSFLGGSISMSMSMPVSTLDVESI